MKQITTKIIAIICILCMAGSMLVSAAGTTEPTVSIQLDSTKKNAEITLNNVGTMIYSAQIILKITATNADYTLTTKNKNTYGTVKTDGNEVTLYIDSTELMNGSKSINIAKLKSSKAMSIGNTADLILVDRSWHAESTTYSGVKVKVTTETTNNNGGGGGNGGNLNPPNRYTPNVFSPSDPSNSTPVINKTFTDVPKGFWAEQSVTYVTEKGLFEGTSDTEFEPFVNMTRAMYVTVLKRFGTQIDPKWQLECQTPKRFADVPSNAWFSDAVGWAGGTGVVNGMGDNMFNPDSPITREQMAVIIVNFASKCGVELPAKTTAVNFTDSDSIGAWAADAVATAQRAGLIYGRSDGSFDPKNTATRAEVAIILHRLAELGK